jgi:hypothetical protein
MSRPIVSSLVLMLVALAGCQAECESCGPAPELSFLAPESLLVLPMGATGVDVNFSVAELILDPGDEVVEGQGKVALALDAVPDAGSGIVSAEPPLTFELPGDLPAGPHRILGQLVRGDGMPYENPEASAHTVFFIEDSNPARPQVAFVEPQPFSEHVVGEPLEVHVAVRNFELISSYGPECHAPEDCDPFDLAIECLSGDWNCEGLPVSTTGHVKVYGKTDYPACLFDSPLDCNPDYLLILRPASEESATQWTASISADQLTQAGSITLSAALSYGDHNPYPNRQFLIYDQITIELVER